MADGQATDLAKLRRRLEAQLAGAGIDASRPDFMRRAYDQLIESRTRLTIVKGLVDQTTLQETSATGTAMAPGHKQTPQLGTTAGDIPDIQALGGKSLDDGQKFKDEFLDRMWARFEQGGLKITPGEAAGRTEPGDGATGGGPVYDTSDVGSSDFAASTQLAIDDAMRQAEKVKQDWQDQQREIEITQWLVIAAATADQAYKNFAEAQALTLRIQQQDDLLKRLNDQAMHTLDKYKQPNPDAPDDAGGGDTLPFGDKAPKLPHKPGDPVPDDPGWGSGGVLKQRGQATDPNPAADHYDLGDPKKIRTTGDAVTDPPRDPSQKRGFFSRLMRGRR